MGAVFAHKETKNQSVLLNDFVADSPTSSEGDVKVLCIPAFDYQITIDKHLIREKALVAESLSTLKSFEQWTQAKFDSFSQNFRIKRYNKGEIILDKGQEVNDVLLIRSGKLRLEKNLTMMKQNIWPSANPSAENGNVSWDVSKTIQD